LRPWTSLWLGFWLSCSVIILVIIVVVCGGSGWWWWSQ
jgi:hypothetical protein